MIRMRLILWGRALIILYERAVIIEINRHMDAMVKLPRFRKATIYKIEKA